jgi:glycolate oxidase iron-sulfur subunit
MQTTLADFIKGTPEGDEAEAILRKCVHCGFCTATCPTYQLLGDELDGPRGRIYLIKQALEGKPVTKKTQLHLDRCLTCRACETTCPSGVHYSRLLDIGRGVVEARVQRTPGDALARTALRKVLTRPALFHPLLKLGQAMRPVLPGKLRRKVPASIAAAPPRPSGVQARKMLVLEGCVQPSLAPATNAAAARVLDKLGISLVPAAQAGCCGAVSFHLEARGEALDFMRRNIDAWWPYIEDGVEAIVMTASGCAVMVKDYGYQLAHDPQYAEKAARVSALCKDLSVVLASEAENLQRVLAPLPAPLRVSFHSPCTLQHGLALKGEAESLLATLGYDVLPIRDSHLCCGSAGTYSLLHPDIARRLRNDKLDALTSPSPDQIVTANIGCQTHLQSGTPRRVRHWVELLADRLNE